MTEHADTETQYEAGGVTNEDGYVLVLVALLLVPLLAFTAFAVDLGAWYARAAQIQRAADAAALAGVKYLPSFDRATSEAREVAARNGFAHDPGGTGITVTVADAGLSKLRVTISDPDVNQYFSGLFVNNLRITRSATAEFIKSVPMGSPRNFLGTGNQLSGAWRENFWVSVSGYCARREHGDRITPISDANGGSTFDSCIPGNPSGVVANPEYRADGYFYGIELKQNYTGTLNVEIFDAPHCQGANTGANDSGASTNSARRYDFILRANDSLDPTQATILGSHRITPADCGAMANQWVSLFDIVNPQRGVYFLQIRPVIPTSRSGADSQEGQNQLGIRIADNGTFTPCTTDPNSPEFVSSRNCPNVYGLTHLGVQATFAGSFPSFFLASIGPEHNNKAMDVELFDAAEGALGIELLDPNGNPVNFRWEIACMDGSYRSENGGNCATNTGENPPPGGYGDGNLLTNYLDVSGTAVVGNRPWGPRNSQDGKYSDRLIRLRVQLPADINQAYSGRTWWRIRYRVCSGCTIDDRTTWSITLRGDPLRLVPNS